MEAQSRIGDHIYTASQVYELSLLMLCIWREARSEPPDGQHAVGWVIKNRLTHGGRFGKSYAQVILKPSQFSSFNPGDPNSAKFPIPEVDPAYGPCMLAAKHVYDGTSADPTHGAQYYFAESMAADPPAWSKEFQLTVKIGRHSFYVDPSL